MNDLSEDVANAIVKLQEKLAAMSPEQRMDVLDALFEDYCTHCGDDMPCCCDESFDE